MNLNSLSRYTKPDREKQILIDDALKPSRTCFCSLKAPQLDMDMCMDDYAGRLTKICPECHRKYGEDENFCFECLVALNDITEIDIRTLKVEHDFPCDGSNVLDGFDEIFTDENFRRIEEFKFTKYHFTKIIKSIKTNSLKNMDDAIKANSIDLESLSALERVLLFAKSFVDIEYKSYGQELGFYSFNRISVDDRQLDVLQITTLLHELTHFLVKEILTQILCRLLDASKTKEIETVITFILTYSKENCLIDEYAAHTVEGRFTLFGYQDYSSFLSIQKEIDMPDEDIEMLKTIGNTFAHMIKTIIEAYIGPDLLDDIKSQFKSDILDRPDYTQLKHENCILLTYDGFFRAIQFILLDGFAFASQNVEKLIQINDMWQTKTLL